MLQAKDFSNFTRHLQVPHFELNAKTLGLIGAGAISRQTAVVAHALGMNILVYSRSRKDWADLNAAFVSLDEVLAAADFLSIHCPLTPETRHLLDRHRFGQMKSTAYIINTARGPIIHEADLIDALQNKRLAGAALDVQDPEPPALDNPLFTMDNVLLTPHIGWQTLESRQRLIGLLADNIAAWLQGKPVNTVA